MSKARHLFSPHGLHNPNKWYEQQHERILAAACDRAAYCALDFAKLRGANACEHCVGSPSDMRGEITPHAFSLFGYGTAASIQGDFLLKGLRQATII